MSVSDKSFNSKDMLKEFIESFNSTEECANECMQREREFVEQFQAYMNCIAALCNDKRYIPIVTMRRIGIACGMAIPKDDAQCIFVGGNPDGINDVLKTVSTRVEEG